ncbi:MAG: hypothetical protein K2G03_00395 [Bacilli bacterium]|nr:hypothetical protein [Bacilli bacterium]
MFEKMLAQSNTNLQSLKKEREFLIGCLIYFSTFLRFVNNDPETIDKAINEITSYLSKILEVVNHEYDIMDAVNRYLYALCNNIVAFQGFETSEEFTLFKGIFELLNNTYPKRVSEYLWYVNNYKSYVNTRRIAKGYKIISKRKLLDNERYEKILSTIPKV